MSQLLFLITPPQMLVSIGITHLQQREHKWV